jgi:CubicO group peptidase (beta-lactamase class C family)
LRHQSGIYNYTANPAFSPLINTYPDSIFAWEDVIKTLVKAPLFQPGVAFSYSKTHDQDELELLKKNKR